MAVIYSKLGGYLGATAKLGPLARTDLCTGVKGLLDRLMTHFGLGSSREDPWGPTVGLGVRMPSQVPALSAWEAVLFPWEAWRALCLAEYLGCCLPDLVPWLPDCPAWGELSPVGGRWVPTWEAGEAARLSPSSEKGEVTSLPAIWKALEACLPACNATTLFLPQGEGECLPAWDKLLPSPGGRWVPAWEVATWLPAWDATKLLLSPGGRRAPACLPAWVKLLPSPGGRWAPAWEETTWLPAWDKLLTSPEGRWAPAWDKLLDKLS